MKAFANGLVAASLVISGPVAAAQDATAPAAAAAAPTDKELAKAQRAAAKAEAKKLAALKREYGDGPYPDEISAFVDARPEPLRPLYKSLFVQGEHAAVLNLERIGVAAMELGHYPEAERALDAALERIEAIYSKDPQAEKARSLFRKEANKDFKGEPYERAMAYYYRGLLYLRAGDYENARASFETAEFQDTVSEDEQFQSDFAVMNYLSGWASQCNGDADKARDAFAAAAKANSALVPPAENANLLMISELGQGPVKTRSGSSGQMLAFEPAVNKDGDDGVVYAVAAEGGPASEVRPVIASSLYQQASTRGGRPVQGILNGKAQFKEGMDTASSVASSLGTSLMSQGNMDMGMAGMGLGLVMGLLGGAAKADADIRMWDNLPDNLLVATAAVPGLKYTLAPRYMKQAQVLDITGAPVMRGQGGRCGIAWSRSHSAVAVPAEAPGLDANVIRSRSRDRIAAGKDRLFRTSLAAQ